MSIQRNSIEKSYEVGQVPGESKVGLDYVGRPCACIMLPMWKCCHYQFQFSMGLSKNWSLATLELATFSHWQQSAEVWLFRQS